MKLTKTCDLLLVHWHSLLSIAAAFAARAERNKCARVTGNRIKALTRGAYENVVYTFDDLPTEDFLPAGEYYLGESNSAFASVPPLHRFREVLGVDPVVPFRVNCEKPLSHISQYRLAAYVAGLPLQQQAAVYATASNCV
jgi:hypothetical protein